MDFSKDTQCLIKCCLCGAQITGNGANMCINCIKNTIDLAEGIDTELEVSFCKNCGRWLTASKQWASCERESGDLLGLMLKLNKGLKKIKVVDACFVWTEPHSRRMIIKLTYKKSILNGVIVQNTVDLHYKEIQSMCPDCNKVTTNYLWEACVQLRQKVEHKRTLLNLEQIIIQKHLHKNASDVDLSSSGLDFYFQKKGDAITFMNSIKSLCILNSIHSSRQVVSQDIHNNVYKNRYTYKIDIPTVCKEDIVIIPKSLYSGYNNVLLCTRISSSMRFIDVTNMNVIDVYSAAYSKHPFGVLMTSSELKEYICLDIEPVDSHVTTPHYLAEITIIKESDFGVSDDTITVFTHLGGIVEPGDTVLGYDIRSSNFNNDDDNTIHKKVEKQQKHKPFDKAYKHTKEEKGAGRKEIERYEQDKEFYYDDEMDTNDIDYEYEANNNNNNQNDIPLGIYIFYSIYNNIDYSSFIDIEEEEIIEESGEIIEE
ncbi:hypothetical protein WA158_001737 [Blastocystis sp. Blastoise]